MERAKETKTTGLFFFLSRRTIPRELRDIILIVSSHLLLYPFGSVLRVGDRCIHTDKIYRDFIIPLTAVINSK
jgi:hypothetical protein